MEQSKTETSAVSLHFWQSQTPNLSLLISIIYKSAVRSIALDTKGSQKYSGLFINKVDMFVHFKRLL